MRRAKSCVIHGYESSSGADCPFDPEEPAVPPPIFCTTQVPARSDLSRSLELWTHAPHGSQGGAEWYRDERSISNGIPLDCSLGGRCTHRVHWTDNNLKRQVGVPCLSRMETLPEGVPYGSVVIDVNVQYGHISSLEAQLSN